ncbi:bifunctional folylpolyglutamate synthase/dihydrofolate synthase [Sporosarcina contaminans]|uniref:Bifunctional folylpolyglutamate synthase/dihydrofolate synthase n=1 Tax=Sporosarcina contaminans TaxID=633403 RepID=A0ABW3TUC2_9BACL
MIPKLNDYKERFQIDSVSVIKPGLDSMRKALENAGNPEKDLRIIHVAGTNGKGSTIAFMEAMLKEHGYKTGVFSSPALYDVHDQIRFDGRPIRQEEMERSFEKMKEAGVSGLLTDFELLTVAAFVAFERNKPDYVLLECGMGGTLDSTNVVTPIVSVITTIAKDHESFLGNTIREIAKHKAGIIKETVPVIAGELPREAEEVIRKKAFLEQSNLLLYGTDFKMCMDETEIFSGSRQIPLQNRRMKGPHQGMNCAVAIQALLSANVPLQNDKIVKAVEQAQLPFRFQEVAPNIFLDGAHNPAAAKVLAETIRKEFPGEKVDFVIGMLSTKDIRATLDELIPVASSFTFLPFSHPSAASTEMLLACCNHPVKRAEISNDETIILKTINGKKKIVAGSLYLLAGLLNHTHIRLEL